MLLHEYECRSYLALLCFSLLVLHCWRYPPFLSHTVPQEKFLAWNPKRPLRQSLPDPCQRKQHLHSVRTCRSMLTNLLFKIHTASLSKNTWSKWRRFYSTLFKKAIVTGILHAALPCLRYFSRMVFHCHPPQTFWSLWVERQASHIRRFWRIFHV